MNEELQSTNEELETINDELRQRTLELNEVNAFLETILVEHGVAVIVVDREQRVQIWNGQSTEDSGACAPTRRRASTCSGSTSACPLDGVRRRCCDVLAGREGRAELVLDARNRRGRDIRCRVTLVPLVAGGEAVTGAIVLMEELDRGARRRGGGLAADRAPAAGTVRRLAAHLRAHRHRPRDRRARAVADDLRVRPQPRAAVRQAADVLAGDPRGEGDAARAAGRSRPPRPGARRPPGRGEVVQGAGREQPGAVAAAQHGAVAVEVLQRQADRRAAGADEPTEHLVGQGDGHDDPVDADAPEALGQVPEERQQAVLDPRELGDAPLDLDAGGPPRRPGHERRRQAGPAAQRGEQLVAQDGDDGGVRRRPASRDGHQGLVPGGVEVDDVAGARRARWPRCRPGAPRGRRRPRRRARRRAGRPRSRICAACQVPGGRRSGRHEGVASGGEQRLVREGGAELGIQGQQGGRLRLREPSDGHGTSLAVRPGRDALGRAVRHDARIIPQAAKEHEHVSETTVPTKHARLVGWVEEIASLVQPDDVHWCDGSAEEYDRLCRLLVEQGTFRRLSDAKRPNSYLAWSDPADVARVEDRTFICAEREEDAGPDEQLARPGRDARRAREPLPRRRCRAARCTSCRSRWARSARTRSPHRRPAHRLAPTSRSPCGS